jgi:predicted acetyltransferase
VSIAASFFFCIKTPPKPVTDNPVSQDSANGARFGNIMDAFAVRDIRLDRPHIRYRASFMSAMAEFQTDSDKSAWVYLGDDEPHDTPAKDFEAYVLRLRSMETTAPSNFVKSTCYWAMYKDEVIGRIAIRHELNNFLCTIGGHIGYIVRPSFRKMGVASEMLRQLLETDQARAIKRLLLTCDEDNAASERTIIKNGGAFECLVNNGDKPKKKRFWIDLSENRNG